MAKENTVKSGISFSALFFIVLFILKVCEIGVVATWSWWWITAPLWIPTAIAFVIIVIAFIITLFTFNR